jgi:hypothetical protein
VDKKYKLQLSRILKVVVLLLILLLVFKKVLVLVILIGISLGLSFFVNNLNLRSFGIELVTLVAVLSGMKFGPWIAALLTFVLILYHLATGGFFGIYWFWVIPAYCLGAIISGFMPATDVSTLGTFVTLGINAVSILFTGLTTPGFLPRYMIYSVTNVIFNIILFSLVARPLLLLMI